MSIANLPPANLNLSPPLRNVMSVMGREGDVKTVWNPDNEEEVEAARKQFDDLVGKKKFLAFAVKKDGEKGEQIKKFDPEAGKIILVPPMQGG